MKLILKEGDSDVLLEKLKVVLYQNETWNRQNYFLTSGQLLF
jgi:hypothetical protein